MSREELLQRTRDALSSIKTRERNLNKKRIADGLEPYKYEEHFNPDDFTLEEFRTLWGSGNMYAFNAAGEKIPELGKQLGHGAIPLEQGGSVTLGQVRGEIGVGNIRRGNIHTVPCKRIFSSLGCTPTSKNFNSPPVYVSGSDNCTVTLSFLWVCFGDKKNTS
jgi:hypothetical protein